MPDGQTMGDAVSEKGGMPMRCRLQRKIYRNEENGYTVASFLTKDGGVPAAARKKSYSATGCHGFTAVGYGFPLAEEIEIEMEGQWVSSDQHGMQFHVERFTEVVPRTEAGITGYLSSGAIKGIGPKTAEEIYARFGNESLEVMEHHPEELLIVRGITERRLGDIKTAFGKSRSFRELMTFLAPYHVTPKKVNRILQEFGDQSIGIVKHAPFLLCSIKGFGFLTVDDIARKCGCRRNDPMRVSSCASYVLREANKEGHLYLEQRELIARVIRILNHNQEVPDVSEREVSGILYRLIQQGSIVSDSSRIYIREQYEEEERTAEMIAGRLLARDEKPDIEFLLEEAQEKLGIALSGTQKTAVRMVFENQICIITGGPGTGKTTVLKVILYIYQKIRNGEVQLMAPTGRAAKRMAESTGFDEASTMHMALGLVAGGESYLEFEYLTADFINIDEMSMVDMHVSYEFFLRLPARSKVVLVGDVDQLPSVGAGDVFRQLIACGLIPVTVLDVVYRQDAGSSINMNARLMQGDSTSFAFGEDFKFIACKGIKEAAEIVKRLYLDEIYTQDTDDVQILTPYRKKGVAAGVTELNKVLQDIVNPGLSGKKEVKLGKLTFRVGDKIIQNKNVGGISNGDMGMVLDFFVDEDGINCTTLQFGKRKVTYEMEKMDIIEHAYATTVHKSQGSEYPVVILPWVKGFYGMLKRNILYTAITRAKAKVIIVGEWQAVCQAVHTVDDGKRNTALAERIIYNYRRLAKGEQDGEQLKLAI